MTIMFCSFDTSPRIVRFFCTGRVVEWDDGRFAGLVRKMGKGGKVEGARAVVCLEVWKVRGFAFFTFFPFLFRAVYV